MSFDLNVAENEVRIYDEKSRSTQLLYARDPSPREQLAYERERVVQRGSRTHNRIRQTRLKYGCLVLARPQAAATPRDEGYGFRQEQAWVPLVAKLQEVPVDREAIQAQYARAYGTDWAQFIAGLEPWKLFLLARAPSHIERVASVVFEGASEWKQQMTSDEDEEERGQEGNL